MANPRNDTRRPTRAGRTLSVRLASEERAALDALAAKQRMGTSVLARAVLLDVVGGQRPLPAGVSRQPGAVKQITPSTLQFKTELVRVGTNLNQIAHALNRGGGPDPELADALREVRDVMADIRTSLGDVRR